MLGDFMMSDLIGGFLGALMLLELVCEFVLSELVSQLRALELMLRTRAAPTLCANSCCPNS